MRTIERYPYYEVNFLPVGDADAIILAYKENQYTDLRLALIDAGNVGDWVTIQKEVYNNWGRKYVDLAVLTHPDKDHKGGFFGLLQSPSFRINEFWMPMPWRRHPTPVNAGDISIETPTYEEALRLYNHPSDPNLNLINLLEERGVDIWDAFQGRKADYMPLSVVGPTLDFADRLAKHLVDDFEEIEDDKAMEAYVEDAQMDDKKASSINEEPDDLMPANMSSAILLFDPNRKFLLTGDATRASLNAVLDYYQDAFKGCVLKVPHHGSKHNLNTDLIDRIDPQYAVISCAGTKKHPSNGVVYWLSKHCNVYSTRISHFYFDSAPIVKNPAKPLKFKMQQ